MVDLFHFLSVHVVKPFMQPEMVDRIAQFLNYYLYHLASPKSVELKVTFFPFLITTVTNISPGERSETIQF